MVAVADRAKFIGEMGAIIGGSLLVVGLIIYYIEHKKREEFGKRIYID